MRLSIFKVPNVSGANVMMAALFAGNLGMFFLLTLYLQGVEGYKNSDENAEQGEEQRDGHATVVAGGSALLGKAVLATE